MNINFVIGNLIKDPEKIEGTSKILVKLVIAAKGNYTNADGERPSQFFNIVVWGKLADNCYKYLEKGSKIAVVGKLQNRSWEDANGNKKYITEIVADEVEFISTNRHENDDDLPI